MSRHVPGNDRRCKWCRDPWPCAIARARDDILAIVRRLAPREAK